MQNEVHQKESEQDEVDRQNYKGAYCAGKVTHLKEQLVICNDKDTGGRARAIMHEEWLLHLG